MTAPLPGSRMRPAQPVPLWPVVPGWALAVALLTAAAAVGLMVGSPARPLFILGCAALGYHVWRQGAEAHLQALLVLFAFAPLVRRLIDLRAGFDASGLTLVGPLVFMGLPGLLVIPDLVPEKLRSRQVWPVATVAGCVVYAVTLTMFQGDWTNAASNALKSLTPLVYAVALMASGPRPERLLRAAAAAFVVILPVIGLYGIYQYVDPPEWDRFWMNSASILSAGQPIPYGVRTFSVLNGPASFATFTAAGLVLVLFLRPAWWTAVLLLPAAAALLLSMYRTAWLSLAVGLVFCLMFRSTRARAAAAFVAIAAMTAATLVSPFGEVVLDRFSSLAAGAGDGSARERLDQFFALWMRPDTGLFGSGYATVDVGSAGSMAIDGMFITCWMSMGLIVGLVCIGALFLAIGNAIAGAWSSEGGNGETSVVIGALACGAIVQMPLANIISAELGFLFWTFVVLVPAVSRPARHRPRTGQVP